ncbi:hypothetical protein GW17_00003208 [Ensete ventricosum]|nr:hypothetical protein GW17_00003208 [Ensete ventricosum]
MKSKIDSLPVGVLVVCSSTQMDNRKEKVSERQSFKKSKVVIFKDYRFGYQIGFSTGLSESKKKEKRKGQWRKRREQEEGRKKRRWWRKRNEGEKQRGRRKRTRAILGKRLCAMVVSDEVMRYIILHEIRAKVVHDGGVQ